MKLATKTTLDGRIALKEYIDASVNFLRYLNSGEKDGILQSSVTSPAGPLGDDKKRKRIRGEYGAEWEVHVVPTK
jgi:platelet-activating factor acetylhydrolase